MVGIGGIGMSALAQLLKDQGKAVSGSDRDESPTIALLREKRVDVTIGHGQVPDNTELLIYSDAVWPDNPERMAGTEKGIRQISYFEALGEVSENMRTLAVTGTHGKTTTTGMLAAILKAAGKEPTAIVGSIVKDFGSNYLAGRKDLLVVEGCEYRDHVLKLNPEILVLTNVELDHTDFFPSLDALQESFRKAAEKIPANGALVTNPNNPTIAAILENVRARVIDYTKETAPVLKLIGEFNALNARAAKGAAKAAFPDLTDETMDAALARFHGSWRRFEYKGESRAGATVYDDYAHHPTEIAATLKAVREKFPEKHVVVAFHPHLYSRTKSLLKEFATALAKADRAIIAPIYPAREAPDPTISQHVLADATNTEGGKAEGMDSFDEIRDALLNEKEGTLIITMGAGDIYKVAEQMTEE
jgi:UDP-N-acetylmuramate--alanine ligase